MRFLKLGKNKKRISVFVLFFLGLLFVIFMTGSSKQEEKKLQRQQEKLLELKGEIQKNPDMAAWLTIPETTINYPVMQRMEDENYYLHRDFYGRKNENGTLILSNGCDITKENTIWIIHGHNMSSGAMFGSLQEYRNPDFRQEHSLIYLEVEDEIRTYLVMGVFESQVYYEKDEVFKFYQCYEIENREDFEYFYQNIQDMFLYDTGIDAVYGDSFLLLSTCSYHTENGRFVVAAKQVYL